MINSQTEWVWINAKPSEGRLGRLFGDDDLIIDAGTGGLIYGKPEVGRLIRCSPKLLWALKRIRGWREIDRNTLTALLSEIEDIADKAIKEVEPHG